MEHAGKTDVGRDEATALFQSAGADVCQPRVRSAGRAHMRRLIRPLLSDAWLAGASPYSLRRGAREEG